MFNVDCRQDRESENIVKRLLEMLMYLKASCFILGCFVEHRCRWKTNYSMGWFQFCHCQLPIYRSNIPLSPAYGVYISQLIRYTRACSTYNQFSSRGRQLTNKLIIQGFLQYRLTSAFRKFYGRYNDLIHNYQLSLSHMLSDIFHSNS
jgi:hypothetical protein